MTLSFFLQLVQPYRSGLFLLLVLALAEAGLALVLPIFAGHFGALFLADSSQIRSVVLLVASTVGILALIACLRAASALLHARHAETILCDLRQRLFNHMLALPLP